MLWEIILATMLFLQAPGKSIHSMVPTTADGATAILDEVNGHRAYRLVKPGEPEPLACQGKVRVACEPPRQRDVIYNLRPIRKRWERPETYDEGLERYVIIAKSIAAVAEDREWKFPAGQLWRYLLTIAFHESGFRRDVHTGLGRWALGDCLWRQVNGPRGKVRVPGTCRSHGLYQSLFAQPRSSRLFGFGAMQVVGANEDATRRATIVAAKHLERLWPGCSANGRRSPQPGCIFAAYGGVRSAKDPRIQGRVGTFIKVINGPTELDDYVRKQLGLDDNS